ncbi:hypothetical protein Tco_1019103 [Tanacetum coccineum]|uniref:Reverse transcriptase Ty1/copia-type domain-containing protein n=1 Tax=Tanacetum coccineum TaxID=301880 RepID=A0ABQ5FXI0_9ASTR
MELENSQNNALAKLPMLKLGEYEMWEIRIKQYFQIQDYALWEVIENGNSWVPIPVTAPESGPSTALKMTVPSTTEEKICNDDVKARNLEGMNATEKDSEGPYEANKIQNVKFLRSLPSEWDTHVVVWMNKPDFDTMGLDDLYNNFKIIEQKVKISTGVINDEKNLAFLTTTGASSINNINTVNPEVSTGQEVLLENWKERSSLRGSSTADMINQRKKFKPNMALMAFLGFLGNNDKSVLNLVAKIRKILKYKESEVLFSKEIALLKRSVGHKEYQMGLLRTELEKVKEEKEGFEFKIAKFEKSSKDLDQLLASQITDKSKKGFGYNAVPSPHPLILNRPTSLDFIIFQSLQEFKKTTDDNSKENTDDSLKQQQKTDSSSVKSPLKVDKDWKEKFFCPANQVREEEPKKARENKIAFFAPSIIEKKWNFGYPNVHKLLVPRAVLNGDWPKKMLLLLGAISQLKDRDFVANGAELLVKDRIRSFNTGSEKLVLLSLEVNIATPKDYAIYEGKSHQDLHTCLLFVSSLREEQKRVSQALEIQHSRSNAGETFQFYSAKRQDKYVHEILRKFNYSNVKSASTPTDLEKPLVQDGDAADVDEHLYRSMIGSLMYLHHPDQIFMFAVMACARFQVSPKTSHLLAVKRIFRYLKGKPSLGLWYSKDSPLDYAGATLDRKSTTGGCEFLGNRLISWQCKKQTVVSTSTTEAEYVATTSCCGQRSAKVTTAENGEVKIAATIDGHSLTITEGSLRRHLKLDDQDGLSSIPNSEIFEQLALMGYHTDSNKLTFQKGAFSPQWRFLIHSILYCLSPKKTAWEQFSSNIATAVICQEVALFPTMLDVTEPSPSPSRITTSASPSPDTSPSHSPEPSTQHSPDNTTVAASQPSPTQPLPTHPSPGAYTFSTPLNYPLMLFTHMDSDESRVSNKDGNAWRIKLGLFFQYDMKSLEVDSSNKGGNYLMRVRRSDEVSTAGLQRKVLLSEEVQRVSTVEIARDEEIARQWDEEERQRAMAEAKSTKQIDWNDPLCLKVSYSKMDPKTVPKQENLCQLLEESGNYRFVTSRECHTMRFGTIFEMVWGFFNQNIEPIDVEHGSEKKKSLEKSPEKMKSAEKMEEEDVATQKVMKVVLKKLSKEKKSIP